MRTLQIIIASAMLYITMALPAYSWDLGAGITTYYSMWNPAFIKQHKDTDIDPAILLGPVLSLQFFERFVLSGQLLASLPGSEADYTITLPNAGNVSVSSKCERLDVEGSLMYTLNPYFKIFAGFKSIEFQETDMHDIRIENTAYTSKIDIWDNEFRMSGPAGGVLIAIPVSEKLKAAVSTSLLYFNMEFQGYYLQEQQNIAAGTNFVGANKVNYKYKGIGNNSSLVFSYYIPSFDTALNIGVRCQYLKYSKEGDAPDLGSDLNYGATLSAMYFF